LAAFSIAAAFVLAGWVVPSANQEFRQIVYEMHGGHGPLARGAAERTLPDLLLAYSSKPTHEAELQVHGRFALIAACPALILLAGQLQPMRRRHRWVLAPFFLFLLRSIMLEGVRLGALEKPVVIWTLPLAAFVAAAVIGCWRYARADGRGPGT
jgi:lipopolysaccharide export LptBFGC system permease protein LptF